VRIISWLNKTALFAGGAVLLGMMALGCVNMGLRFFGYPVKGTFELMGFGGALVAACALGKTQEGRGHIEVRLLDGIMPPRLRQWVQVASDGLAAGFFALVGWQVMKLAYVLKESGELSETLHIFYYPIVLAVGLGFLCLVLTLLGQILLELRSDGGSA
jgi:TRAP-type C4-dicarboxylate transport system permease small subunit